MPSAITAQIFGIALLLASVARAADADPAARAEDAARRAEAAAARSEDAARRVEDSATRLERLVERLQERESAQHGHAHGR